MNVLHLKKISIFDQLVLEERLLRETSGNWCIINEGSPRTVVMGISGKPEELLDLNKIKEDCIPVIKRFSGGGTVIVDENTLFVTFICQKELHSFSCSPEPIYKWSEELYRSVFSLQYFSLKENDYALLDKKCGGNAQYLKKDRWLHHTSFLWDFEKKNMDYLLHPKKTPRYREGRSHEDFLCRMKDYLLCKDRWISSLKTELNRRYQVREKSLEDARSLLKKESRQSTCYIEVPT
jgi:lipoate-protein ligase A